MVEIIKTVPLEFYRVLAEMAPYLLFGFAVAGILSVFISAEQVERHLGGNDIWAVLKAAAVGVPLPLCSCGVIPVAASLRRSGASRGATTSFLLSTPQTGVDSIFVTYSLLGLVFAVFRPLAALLTGVIGGSLVNWLDKEDQGSAPAGSSAPVCAGDSCGCEDSCAADKPDRGRLYRVLEYGFVTLPADIGRALLIGLLIAGIIAVIVPDDFFAGYLHNPLLQIFIMMALGLPLYVCATASVPVAAALMMKGISPGAAFAFLMTGPATNAATISTIYKIMGRRTAVIYLATVATLAVAFGLLLNGIDVGAGMAHHHHDHAMGLGIVNHLSAGVLILVLAYALLRRRPAAEVEAGADEQTWVITVSGMRCNQCSLAVERALSGCAGVSRATVDLARGTATVYGRELRVESLCDAIRQLGYSPGEVKGLPGGKCPEPGA